MTPDDDKPVLGYAPASHAPDRRAGFWERFWGTLLLILLVGIVLAVALFFYFSIMIGGVE